VATVALALLPTRHQANRCCSPRPTPPTFKAVAPDRPDRPAPTARSLQPSPGNTTSHALN
jgi:hypothetical protein